MNVLARIQAIVVLALLAPGLCAAATFFISPQGDDKHSGREREQPVRSFARAFSAMQGGDTLVLLSGEYSRDTGTGGITYDGPGSAQPPSGKSADQPTRIHAEEPGKAVLKEPLLIGRSFRKDEFIEIRGLTVLAPAALYNTRHVTVKECGFGDGFGIGTNDHHHGNTDNLVEDVWIWASGKRIIAINYRSHNNVWRRVVVRGDGCGTAKCQGSGNPNVGFTVYDSHDVSVQNMLIVDRVLAPTDYRGADFATAQHTPDPRYYFGRNEWLGIISLHAPDIGYYNFPDTGQTLDPTSKVVNAVVWNSTSDAFDLDREGTHHLENLTAMSRHGDVVRIGPTLASRGGTLRNVIAVSGGDARYGINAAYPSSHTSVWGEFKAGAYNQKPCTAGCLRTNPRTGGAPALKYITRIEAGSALKGKGHGGADIGANVVYRYGADGSRHGEPGYNTLTTTALWPWPHEARIKAEMCATTSRGFCSAGKRLDGVNPVTLTSYVWETLGHPMPASLYDGKATTSPKR
ncbi:MAG: hypothetical protein AB1430_05710 [Pseudomonadota bacterium]